MFSLGHKEVMITVGPLGNADKYKFKKFKITQNSIANKNHTIKSYDF